MDAVAGARLQGGRGCGNRRALSIRPPDVEETVLPTSTRIHPMKIVAWFLGIVFTIAFFILCVAMFDFLAASFGADYKSDLRPLPYYESESQRAEDAEDQAGWQTSIQDLP